MAERFSDTTSAIQFGSPTISEPSLLDQKALNLVQKLQEKRARLSKDVIVPEDLSFVPPESPLNQYYKAFSTEAVDPMTPEELAVLEEYGKYQEAQKPAEPDTNIFEDIAGTIARIGTGAAQLGRGALTVGSELVLNRALETEQLKKELPALKKRVADAEDILNKEFKIDQLPKDKEGFPILSGLPSNVRQEYLARYSQISQDKIKIQNIENRDTGFAKQAIETLTPVREYSQAVSEKISGLVDRTGEERLSGQAKIIGDTVAAKYSQGDFIGGTIDLLSGVVEIVKDNPKASLDMFAESLPMMLAASKAIGSTTVILAAEEEGRLREEFIKENGVEPNSEQIKTLQLAAFTKTLLDTASDKALVSLASPIKKVTAKLAKETGIRPGLVVSKISKPAKVAGAPIVEGAPAALGEAIAQGAVKGIEGIEGGDIAKAFIEEAAAATPVSVAAAIASQSTTYTPKPRKPVTQPSVASESVSETVDTESSQSFDDEYVRVSEQLNKIADYDSFEEFKEKENFSLERLSDLATEEDTDRLLEIVDEIKTIKASKNKEKATATTKELSEDIKQIEEAPDDIEEVSLSAPRIRIINSMLSNENVSNEDAKKIIKSPKFKRSEKLIARSYLARKTAQNVTSDITTGSAGFKGASEYLSNITDFMSLGLRTNATEEVTSLTNFKKHLEGKKKALQQAIKQKKSKIKYGNKEYYINAKTPNLIKYISSDIDALAGTIVEANNIIGSKQGKKVKVIKGQEQKSKVTINKKAETTDKFDPDNLDSNKTYVFGDNDQRKGTGKASGQAIIRGKSNAVGIRTKKAPNNTDSAFYNDNELEANKKKIDEDIGAIKATGKSIVLAKDGYGTGRADLKNKAPKTFEYLSRRLYEEFGFVNPGYTPTQKKKVITKPKKELPDNLKIKVDGKEVKAKVLLNKYDNELELLEQFWNCIKG